MIDCKNFAGLISHINEGKESLFLSKCELTEEEAIQLADILEFNTSLESLNLKQNVIGADGIRKLAKALGNNTSIKNLYICDEPMGIQWVLAFTETLLNNKSMELFSLHHSNIGDIGAKVISTIISSTSLKVLDLSKNNIGNEGAELLDKAVLAKPDIVCAWYDNISNQVEAELERREKYIQGLIQKFNTTTNRAFTPEEIIEFYNNRYAIKFIHDIKCGSLDREYYIDISAFNKALASICMPHINLCPVILNIPQLPNALRDEDRSQGVNR